MEELLSWVNKDLESVSSEYQYKHFFDGIELDDPDDNVLYLSNLSKGIELVLSKFEIIESIHFFGKGSAEQNEYKEELPLELDFSFSREKVMSLFGAPNQSGGGHRSIFLGYVNVWDKYYFPTYSLRFEYSKDEKEIVLLTIASLNLESTFDIGLQ